LLVIPAQAGIQILALAPSPGLVIPAQAGIRFDVAPIDAAPN
jgi:hypothetical protein